MRSGQGTVRPDISVSRSNFGRRRRGCDAVEMVRWSGRRRPHTLPRTWFADHDLGRDRDASFAWPRRWSPWRHQVCRRKPRYDRHVGGPGTAGRSAAVAARAHGSTPAQPRAGRMRRRMPGTSGWWQLSKYVSASGQYSGAARAFPLEWRSLSWRFNLELAAVAVDFGDDCFDFWFFDCQIAHRQAVRYGRYEVRRGDRRAVEAQP